jgi:hypothetical protein
MNAGGPPSPIRTPSRISSSPRIFPEEWKERGEALFSMTDEDASAALSVPTPPVPKRRVANG